MQPGRRKWFFILIAVFIVWTLFYAHRLTCQIHAGLCTPFIPPLKIIARLNRFPKAPPTTHIDSCPSTCEGMIEWRREMELPQLALLLMQQKSASSAMQSALNSHPDLVVRGEMFMETIYDCRTLGSSCQWSVFQNRFQESYKEITMQAKTKAKNPKYIAFDLHIDQVDSK